jgi:two-component sensor histidine kinase
MREFGSLNSLLEEHVLLCELNHRINNEFTSIISIVSVAAARSRSNNVKLSLRRITDVLANYAAVHHALQMPNDDGCVVDAADYLRKLCGSIRRSKLERTKIHLVLTAPSLSLRSDQCWLLGLIVHELVTNAVRHAFAKGQGEIRVALSVKRGFIECKVLDNGAAEVGARPGRGLKIIDVLVKRLDGRFEQQFGRHGSSSNLVFPRGDILQGSFHMKPQVRQIHSALGEP